VSEYSLVTRAALNTYRAIERTGALENRLVQDFFQTAYFIYKRTLEDAFAGLVKNRPDLFAGGYILDVGANIGYTSTLFISRLSKGFKLFAFEPEARNFEQLKRAMRRTGRQEEVVALQAAVGSKDGTAELKINRDHHADHRIVSEDTSSAGREASSKSAEQQSYVSVPLRSLDSVMREYGALSPVSFVKIDVQGYELPVFQGMEELIKANPGLTVAFEYDSLSLASMNSSGDDLLAFFKERGFKLSLLSRKGELIPYTEAALASEIAKRAYVDFIAQRR
jgi:FkbM family methyltransferase